MAVDIGKVFGRDDVPDFRLIAQASPSSPAAELPVSIASIIGDSSSDLWELPTAIPASSVEACPTCRSLELWEPAAGDQFGLSPGSWRCQHCDPPTDARRFRKYISNLKNG